MFFHPDLPKLIALREKVKLFGFQIMENDLLQGIYSSLSQFNLLRISMQVKNRWSGRVSTRVVDSLLNKNHFGISWGPAPRDAYVPFSNIPQLTASSKLTKAQIQKIKRQNVQDNEKVHIQKITSALYTQKWSPG